MVSHCFISITFWVQNTKAPSHFSVQPKQLWVVGSLVCSDHQGGWQLLWRGNNYSRHFMEAHHINNSSQTHHHLHGVTQHKKISINGHHPLQGGTPHDQLKLGISSNTWRQNKIWEIVSLCIHLSLKTLQLSTPIFSDFWEKNYTPVLSLITED